MSGLATETLAPIPALTDRFCAETLETIVKPTIRALSNKGHHSELVASAGRVLNIKARGKTVKDAQAKAYAAADAIDWPEGFCRRDIGWWAVC